MYNKTAGIIIIGDEILSGRTQDTNANYIAKQLINNGIDLKEIRVIKDEFKTIKKTVLKFHKLYSYVFTTGGIGPTHDDITSETISKAFKVKYGIHKEAFKILEKYYSKEEFNNARKKMAMLPVNSKLIYNPLTAAPGFIIKNIYVLPGVPSIMQVMFNILLKDLKTRKAKRITTIKTNLFESKIAKKLSNIQKKHKDCSIGSYPFFDFKKKIGGVNIVISSWERENLQDISSEIVKMISLLGGKSKIV